jgi:uncharacterized protein
MKTGLFTRSNLGRHLGVALLCLVTATVVVGQELPPALTQPVNDFANVVDPESARAMDTLIRSLQESTGDVVAVATVETVAPYADIREYAVRMFENHGRGIGERGRDNGVLILLAVGDRQVRVEVGYELEEFITDGFAGETSRQYMAPEFRRGNYGAGLLAGTTRLIERIAQGRQVTLDTLQRSRRGPPAGGNGAYVLVGLFVLLVIINLIAGRLDRRRRRRPRRWGGSPWSGWHSGVGPFGGGLGGFGRRGGFGGGFGGFGRPGGFGGGFGGFGGGRSGGGGGGASW